jgi:hypothetical protein
VPRPAIRAALAAAAGATTAALAWIFWPALKAHAILQYDDRSLLDPIARARTLGGLVEEYRHGYVLDLQPLRDLTYLLDLRLGLLAGVETMHATNLVLYALLCAALYAWCRAAGVRAGIAAGAAALFAVHPIHVEPVAWITGRKFLLAALFATTACALFRSGRVRSALGAYFASLVSHPAGLGWPLWAAFTGRARLRERRFQIFVGLGLIGAVAATLGNLVYYQTAFEAQTGKLKVVEQAPVTQAYLVFAGLGRSVFNLVAPLWLAPAYDPYSWRNFAGLALLAAAAAALFWLRRRAPGRVTALLGGDAASGLALALVAYLPVSNLVPMNIFVADRYLLLPSVGLTLAAAVGAERLLLTPPAFVAARIAAFAIAAAFALLARPLAAAWVSDEALWTAARRTEPFFESYAKAANLRLDAGQVQQAAAEIELLERDLPRARGLPGLKARLAYLAQSPDRREAALRDYAQKWPRDPFTHYYLAAALAAQSRHAEALAELELALREPAFLVDKLEIVAAHAMHECREAAAAGQADAGTCEARTRDAAERGVRGRPFDAQAYEARLARLGAAPPRR